MLTPLDGDIWVAEQPLSFFGLRLGSRMTVVRLSDGGLWLHSPIALDDDLRAEVEALGEVRYVVAPNKYHHLSVGDWKGAFPEAVLCAAPGLARKRKDLAIDATLSDAPEEGWQDDLAQVHITANSTFMETVFLHRASGTVISADLALNFQGSDHAATRFYLWRAGTRGKVTLSRMLRPTWTFNRGTNRKAVDRILAWDFDRLVVGHGAVVETGARDTLAKGYRWL